MNNKLISQDTLYHIMCTYLKPELDKCKEIGGHWYGGSRAGAFYWYLHSGVERRNRIIGSCLCDNHFEIYNNRYEFVNIKIFNDHIEFIEDSKFNDFSHDFMYGLYEKIKEYFENVTNSDESNNESTSCNNKHVYILAIDACIDLPTYTFLIKAENKDEAFEIFWNRYKDFPEADIDREFGGIDFYDDDRSIQRLHRETFVRIDENTMESKEEIFSTTSIRLCDAPKCVHMDDDITYMLDF